jgi:hypothetical protein
VTGVLECAAVGLADLGQCAAVSSLRKMLHLQMLNSCICYPFAPV